MKKYKSIIKKIFLIIFCSHEDDIIEWIGDITSTMIDPWSSETGLKTFRKAKVKCKKCGRITTKSQQIGRSGYGGVSISRNEEAYKP